MNSDEQMLPSLDQYFKADREEELSKEAKIMEDKLSLFSFPSFKTIFISVTNNKDLTQALLSNLNEIILSKQISDEKRVELISNQAKWSNEKATFENEISKLRSSFNNLKVKYDKIEQTQLEQKKKWKDNESTLKTDKELCNISLIKLTNKESQYINELKKKDVYISKLLEQIKKFNESSAKKPIIAQNNEIYSSYNLNEKKSNYTSVINCGKNPKEILNDITSRASSDKYQLVIKQNEDMKLALSELNKVLIELTSTQKQIFLVMYKETFGFDFSEGNIDLSIDNGYDLNNDAEKFIEQMKYLLIKLKEFVVRKDELGHNGDGFNIKVRNNSSEDNNNDEAMTCSQMNKRGNIDKAYVTNMIKINQYYKELADDMSDVMLKTVMKENKKNKRELDKIETEKRRSMALNYTINALEYNHEIDSQLCNSQDKETVRKKNIVNYDQLKDELRNYIEILNTTEAYTMAQTQTQHQMEIQNQSTNSES